MIVIYRVREIYMAADSWLRYNRSVPITEPTRTEIRNF